MAALADHLARLLSFLAHAGNAPPTRQIVLVELERNAATDARGRCKVRQTLLQSPEAYEARFAVLLAQGSPWLNLSAVGVDRGRLIVSVEAASPTAAQSTSVNYSGPSASVLENDWSAASVLAIE